MEIILAAVNGNIDQLKKIELEEGFEEGFDLDYALSRAAFEGHFDVVEFMIDHGALNYISALINAGSREHHDIVELIRNRGKLDDSYLEIVAYKIGNHGDEYTARMILDIKNRLRPKTDRLQHEYFQIYFSEFNYIPKEIEE